ncbi:serine hydrolase domain-containing protein [Cohnella mopanensis]|uniref:serine hydrolase domain-containing protein n=1 Tax=Cohnella mopanensis TaxID=2911966 RepID=UPI001EF78EE0|nr:serine hydrolase [Cohnella mopanensis]
MLSKLTEKATYSIAFLLVLIVIFLTGCSSNIDSPAAITTEQQAITVQEPDYWPTYGWRTADAEERGMDSSQLDDILREVTYRPIQSMVVVKNGYIVSEYYQESQPDKDYEIYSVTKSITSALIGIAIEQGLIKSIDDKVLDYFPEYAEAVAEDGKKEITIENLLTMTSGLDWPEWTSWNYRVDPLIESKDWPGFVLRRPMEDKPGESFNYNTGGSQLLASILKKTTGQSEYDFAKKVLFEPLGITREMRWYPSTDGTNTGGFGLKMTARDQAKFGLLYLHGGKWEGKQIVPEDWVKTSTKVHSQGNYMFGKYGYHWWVGEYGGEQVFNAMGYGGQYIFVAPALDLVVVFSSNSPMDATMPQSIYTQIVKAAREK